MGKKGKPKINEMLNWRKSKNMLLKMLMTLQLKEIFTLELTKMEKNF
jgi:hypothetical protein